MDQPINRRGKAGSGPSRGFTLIELLIVVAIVAILVAVAIVAYTRYIKSARMVDGRAFLSTIQARQEGYFQRFGYYCNTAGAHPTLVSGEEPKAKDWAPASAPGGWSELGAVPRSNWTYFEWTVVAGIPAGTPITFDDTGGMATTLLIPGANPRPQPWYYAYGRANLDGSGGNDNCPGATPPGGTGCTIIWTTSARNDIVTINEGE